MAYWTLDPRYTLPYIPIRVLYHTKLQTLFTIRSHHCTTREGVSLSLSLSLRSYLSMYLFIPLSLHSHVPPNHSLSYTCTRTRTSSGTRLQWKWYQTRYCQHLLSPCSCHWSGSFNYYYWEVFSSFLYILWVA